MAWQGAPPYYQDPNQQFYGGQPGYPPNQGYPGGYPQGPPQAGYPPGYPPQAGYPPQGGGYPPQVGYPPQPAGGFPTGGDGYPQAGYQPGGYQPQGGYGAYDPEAASDDVKGFAFNDQSIRKAFIRKVYSILTIQLLFTCGAISLFVLHEGTKMFVQRRPYLVWIALGVAFVLTIMISCCENVRRQTPMNFILLGVFTLAESFMLGAISARYERLEVLMAIGITAAVCLAITIFALQTKWDFTVCGGVLLVALVVFVLFGIIAIFIPGKVVSIVYSALGAVLFSFYLLYDTQLMMGGKHKYALSPEDYIFAALSLYLDVINIFIYILSLIASSRD